MMMYMMICSNGDSNDHDIGVGDDDDDLRVVGSHHASSQVLANCCETWGATVIICNHNQNHHDHNYHLSHPHENRNNHDGGNRNL